MRTLCLSYEFPPLGGGGARVVAGLTGALAGTGIHTDLVTMGFRGLPRRETHHGLSVQRLAPLRLRQGVCSAAEMVPYVVNATWAATRLARNNAYALNHTHFIYPDGLVAMSLKRTTGLKYIITAHGSDVPGYNPDRFRYMHRLSASLWRRIVSHAEAIVCPSRTLESLVLDSIPGARVTVIPNGIDPERFTEGEKQAGHILVVTRMFPRKGVQYLLEALAGIRKDVRVDIVGDGPHLPALKAQARRNDIDARFHGALANDSPELAHLYATAAVFILPSEAENFPVVLLEAMSAGCAIITTSGTGCEEVAGDTAMLVPARDAEAIGAALTGLLDHPDHARDLGRRARARLLEHFTWKRVAMRYRSLYEEIAG